MMAVTKLSDDCDKIDTKMANVQQSGAHRHGEEWDEERLEEAEKTIKEMYIQVTNLLIVSRHCLYMIGARSPFNYSKFGCLLNHQASLT